MGWIAVEAVVHDGHIGTRDENADSTVIQCLQHVGHDEVAAIEEVALPMLISLHRRSRNRQGTLSNDKRTATSR